VVLRGLMSGSPFHEALQRYVCERHPASFAGCLFPIMKV
jgi:hypothetical protein